MSTLTEIESAVTTLPVDQKYELYRYLEVQLQNSPYLQRSEASHRALDIPPVKLGSILRPLTRDDDLLEEMLEGRT